MYRRQHCESTSLRRRSGPSSKWLIHNYTTHSCSRHDLYGFKEPYTWSNIGHHQSNEKIVSYAMNGLSNLNIPYYCLIYVMKGLIPWLNHVYRITYSYVWHDQFACATRLTHMCETRLIDIVWHGPFNMLDKTRAYMCDMTCSRVWHDSSEALGLNAHPHVWLIQMCVCVCGTRCSRRRLHVAPSILL